MREPRRVIPRVDLTAADTGTLVALGRVAPPPIPSPDPPRRPDRGGPKPDPGRVERAAGLADALVAAGVSVDADDTAAVEAIARLDAATAATVLEWIRRGKQAPPDGPSGGRT